MNKIEMIVASRTSWGVQADEALQLVDSGFSCPFCGEFSFFCRGDFERLAASHWYNAVVGFTRWPRASFIGVAVLRCTEGYCQRDFGVPLTQDSALTYMASSHFWQKKLQETQG